MRTNINKFVKITNFLSEAQFERIRKFILEKGDRKTYCNRYNNNPHLRINNFDIYLTPESRQNVSCDESISGFDELVVYHSGEDIQYYHIQVVRRNQEQKDISIFDDLEDGNVYLLNVYEKDLSKMKEKFLNCYLNLILDKVN